MCGIERFAAADQHRHRARRGFRPAAAKSTALYA
jgi:predicted N-acyltransferase